MAVSQNVILVTVFAPYEMIHSRTIVFIDVTRLFTFTLELFKRQSLADMISLLQITIMAYCKYMIDVPVTHICRYDVLLIFCSSQ